VNWEPIFGVVFVVSVEVCDPWSHLSFSLIFSGLLFLGTGFCLSCEEGGVFDILETVFQGFVVGCVDGCWKLLGIRVGSVDGVSPMGRSW